MTARAEAFPPSPATAPPSPGGRVVQGGRAKAYRPLPAAERKAALEAALDAWDRGDYFLAHELLEPAWMGTADPLERDLYQGLIKLSAGFVHAVRGNPAGVAANLRGARDRLASAAGAGGSAPAGDAGGPASAPTPPPAVAGLDLPTLLAEVEDRLAVAEAIAAASPTHGPRRSGEPVRPVVPIDPPNVARTPR